MTGYKKLILTFLFLFAFALPSYAIDTLIFQDTIPDTSAVALTSRAPVLGTSWTKVIDTAGTESFQTFFSSLTGLGHPAANSASNGLMDVATPAPTSADMAVSLTFFPSTETNGTTESFGEILRYQDTSNYYACQVYNNTSGTSFSIRIFKVVSGVITSLVNTSVTLSGSGNVHRCEVVNHSIQYYVDGVMKLAVIDTSITAAGKGGIFAGNLRVSTDRIATNSVFGTINIYNITHTFSGYTTIFTDAFPDGSAVAISSRAPSVGTSWTKAEDTAGTEAINTFAFGFSGIANAASNSSSNRIIYTALPASGSADMAVEFVYFPYVGTSGAAMAGGALVRYQDTSNYYGCNVYGAASGTSYVIDIFKKVSGSVTNLANATVTLDHTSGNLQRCEITGTTLNYYIDGVLKVTTTDSAISAVGKGAIYLGNALVSTDTINTNSIFGTVNIYEVTPSGRTRRMW